MENDAAAGCGSSPPGLMRRRRSQRGRPGQLSIDLMQPQGSPGGTTRGRCAGAPPAVRQRMNERLPVGLHTRCEQPGAREDGSLRGARRDGYQHAEHPSHIPVRVTLLDFLK